MKKILPLFVLLFMAYGAYSNGIDGTWKGKMANGDMELTFVFKMTDGKLTGVVQSPNGDMEITNAIVNGKDFSFDVSFGDMTIKHECTLQADDTINMKASGTPMGEMSLVLKRQS